MTICTKLVLEDFIVREHPSSDLLIPRGIVGGRGGGQSGGRGWGRCYLLRGSDLAVSALRVGYVLLDHRPTQRLLFSDHLAICTHSRLKVLYGFVSLYIQS